MVKEATDDAKLEITQQWRTIHEALASSGFRGRKTSGYGTGSGYNWGNGNPQDRYETEVTLAVEVVNSRHTLCMRADIIVN